MTAARDTYQQRTRRWRRSQVANWLTAIGYTIEATDFQMGRVSVPLIARKAGQVSFVWIPDDRSTAAGPRTQRNVGRAAALWALRFGRKGDLYRFDLAAFPKEREQVEPKFSYTLDAWRL